MDKRNYKLLLILIFVAIIFSACQKTGEDSKNKNAQETKLVENGKVEEKIEKAKKKPYVEGAVIGSMSNYVVDREIWKEFMEEEDQNKAKRSINGVHIPEILLDSPDGKFANEEIEELVAHLEGIYADVKGEGGSEDSYGEIVASFSVYEDEKILSVCIETYNTWEGYFTTYKVYNFSLPDGKFIGDRELLEHFGYKNEDILLAMEESIAEVYSSYDDGYYQGEIDSSFLYSNNNLEGLALNDLWENYDEGESRVFINEVGTPMFIYGEYIYAGSGYYTTVTELDGKLQNNIYSDEYVKMARALGVDIEDEKNKAFIIYLGSGSDEESLLGVLQKLYPWQIAFTNYEDPKLLLNLKEDQEDFSFWINGHEYYLLIPKYKNTAVSLRELELQDNGELKEVENYNLENYSLRGTTLICLNQSEIVPNGKVVMKYRDDTLEFSPMISGKDGSIELPEGVIEAEKILDWGNLMDEDMYSYLLKEKILSIMGKG